MPKIAKIDDTVGKKNRLVTLSEIAQVDYAVWDQTGRAPCLGQNR